MNEKQPFWIIPDIDTGLSDSEDKLLADIGFVCRIADYDDRTNAQLAAKMRCCPKTITRRLARLVEKGYLTISGNTSARRIGLTEKGVAVCAYQPQRVYQPGEILPEKPTKKNSGHKAPWTKPTRLKTVPSASETHYNNKKTLSKESKNAPKVADEFRATTFTPAQLSQSRQWMLKAMAR